MSTTRKSKPAQPSASAVAGEPLESQVPTGALARRDRALEVIDGQVHGFLSAVAWDGAAADAEFYAHWTPNPRCDTNGGWDRHRATPVVKVWPRKERRLMTAGADRARYPDLAGRTVFVSGGGSGIGAAFVRSFRRAGMPRGVRRHRGRAVAGAGGGARRDRALLALRRARHRRAARRDRAAARDASGRCACSSTTRRATTATRLDGRDARILGRQSRRQPAPSLLRRAGGRAADGRRRRRRRSSTWARSRGCAAGRRWSPTRRRRPRSPG